MMHTSLWIENILVVNIFFCYNTQKAVTFEADRIIIFMIVILISYLCDNYD